MNLLLDTHLLIWAAAGAQQLPAAAAALLQDPANTLNFSAVSIWEITVKHGLGRADFRIDPGRLYRGLLENGYREIPMTTGHAIGVAALPTLHKDPFDRLLIAQAIAERMELLTSDATLTRYSGPIVLL